MVKKMGATMSLKLKDSNAEFSLGFNAGGYDGDNIITDIPKAFFGVKMAYQAGHETMMAMHGFV
ncbi:MAG: hypothetical protein K9K75_06375 [Deltaproteobacteria bacterium]|nr:hypothetical protein [Deltaproteobacteria bacterium]